jgi:CheY-like chemotaxis protein
MHFSGKFKIRTKLLINGFFFLSLFTVFLVVYQASTGHLDEMYHHVLNDEHDVKDKAIGIKSLLQESRKNEKSFLLYKKETYADLVFEDLENIQQYAREVVQRSKENGNNEVSTLAENIEGVISSYKETFRNIVDANILKGLTPESGLQGKFRNAAHELFDVHISEHAIADLLIAIIDLNRLEIAYVHSGKKTEQDKFQRAIEAFAKTLASHEMRPTYSTLLNANFQQYRKATTQHFHEVNIDRKEKLRQEMAVDIANLEKEISSIYVPGIRAMVLQMRRHEKDYLLRGELEYVQKTKEIIKLLLEAIEGAGMAEEDVVGTSRYLNVYLENFNALVEEDRQITLLNNTLEGLAKKVEALCIKIIDASLSASKIDLRHAEDNLKLVNRAMLAVCFLAVIVGLLLSTLISRSIIRPLDVLLGGIRSLNEGDLTKRIPYNINDQTETGILSGMFNRMADAIYESNWLKIGQNKLAECIREDKEDKELGRDIIVFLANYLQVEIGALYSVQDDKSLKIIDSYSLAGSAVSREDIKFGEGIVGEAARSKQTIIITDVPTDYFTIQSGLGGAKPDNIIVVPAVWQGMTHAVLELGSISPFSDRQLKLLEMVAEPIAIAIHSSWQRDKTLALLVETQKQAEELQVQQEELKTANEELEEQTQALRQNEEELRSQQEELQVANEELEEKSESLERTNVNMGIKNKELEEARIDIEKKAKDIEDASRYKSEFLANMSHELRTPLNSLLLLSRNLAKNKAGNMDESQIESANIIYNSGKDLLTLINEILDLSKIEAGYMEIASEKIGIRGIADWINANFIHIAKERQLDLAVSVATKSKEFVFSDRQRLEQILKNLVANAIKFTHKGGVSVTFGLPNTGVVLENSDLDKNNCLAISVADTGIGIEPNKHKLIFDAFQQAEGGTARKYGGTGLGLAISRKLAGLLGGEIQLVSEAGKGATFTLYLPFAPANKDEELSPAPEGKTESGVDFLDGRHEETPIDVQVPDYQRIADIPEIADDRKQISHQDKTILIIEDDVNFAKILIKLGHEKGFKCLESASGFGGLDLAERYKPWAIILDIRLPDLDGWQILENLKKNPALRHIPVHMMSGEEKTLEAIKKGAIGFLTKPISEEEMKGAFSDIEDAISHRMKNLLVVEDDALMRQEIIDLIGADDIDISTASSGDEAIKILQERKIDCMILDIGLPDMTGFAVLERLEELTDFTIPPVIVYTGRELTRQESAALQKYTDTVIIKGVKSEERLLDETSLFLHRVMSKMPAEKRKMIASLYDQDDMFKDKKIMIVDDDMRNAFALSRILEDRGMVITIATDGQQALDQLAVDAGIDLILMDIMMPVMDGYETIGRIRAQENFWNLPIIALTAKAMAEDKKKCMTAGASDYLAKPVDESRLLSLLRVWLYR